MGAATILAVIGLGGVFVFAFFNRSVREPSSTGKNTAATSTASQEPELALVNENSVTVLSVDGAWERLTTADFSSRLPEPFRPQEGVDAANGSSVVFSLGTQTTPKEYRSPDRRYTVRLGQPKSDGASVVEIWQPNETPQRLVLRVGTRPVKEAMVLGWGDSKTLLVSGSAGVSRAIFTAKTDGSVAELALLPDSVVWVEGRGTSVWYVTAEQGEGIESEPRPPSELHRVTVRGDMLVLRDQQHVFNSVIPGAGDRIAFVTNDGQSYLVHVGDSSLRTSLGTRQPLLFLDDGRIVLRNGFDLVLFEPSSGAGKKIGVLPEGKVAVFLLPIRLDVLQQNAAALGEPGSRCGGSARLPCKPGFVCSSDSTKDAVEGMCVAVAPQP